ncbi:MAG: permease-like cell division protein FtsX [Gammaproteobacteria bacterium]|nr:permease-like cell division protein FtsX [Gammaproteobacteria bacterium]
MDSVEVIAADEALEQFKSGFGLSELLDSLDGNPLPHTLVARPTKAATPQALAALEHDIRALPGVDQVRIDTQWVARLNAILDFLRRGVWIAAVMLVGAVIVTVGNTIRLDIQNRRDEIEICKLLGASNGFVRRPFLYIGLWYGVIGGIVALLLLGAGYLLLAAPVQRLTGLYGDGLELLGLDWATLVAVLAGGILCGWGGAWSAVSRHLAAIEPK